MYKISRLSIVLIIFNIISIVSVGQNQSLNCPITVYRPCGSGATFNIPPYLIEDIRSIASIGNEYEVKNVSTRRGCRPYIEPGIVPDSVLDPIDDRFSSTIPIGFSFTFYGQTYDSVVVSTNGYISFDLTERNQYATWNLTPGDFPNTSYYAGMIAGPFHDLDPRPTANPPATMKVFYSVIGTTPNRKFIVTYADVPLYTTSCNNRLNTHQIILHESTGVIDIFMSEKRICNAWNSGKAMVGIQNMAMNDGLMAPNRKASSAPWQVLPSSPEVWRFIPNSVSNTLYREVEIRDTFNNLIYTTNQSLSPSALVAYSPANDTVRLDESTYTINFPTIPLPPNFTDSTVYLIRTKYVDLNDPSIFSFNTDTMYVVKDTIRFTRIDTTSTSCIGNDGIINAVTFTGGTSPFSYSLDGGNTYNPLPVSPAPIATGLNSNIQYHLLIKDNAGCISMDTLIDLALDDAMNLRPINDTTVCEASSIPLTAVLNPIATTSTSFNWSTIPNSPELLATISNTNVNNAAAIPNDTITYTISANWGYCNRKDTFTVNVLHKPAPNAGNDVSVCNYDTDAILTASNNDSSGLVTYEWSPAATATDPTSIVTSVTPAQTQVYTLTIRDLYGCNFAITDDVTVTVKPPVPAFAGNDTIAVIGQPHQLRATGGVNYIWSPSVFFTNVSDSDRNNPIAVLNDDQLFTVIVTDALGCVGNDSIFIRVYPGPDYNTPNAFSPNGDGLNDIFRVVPSGIAFTEWFKIYNRSGELVFQTNKWLAGWDGRKNGKTQPDGTYVWIVKGMDKNGKVIVRKGTVMLLH